jgi:hypothetical protein
VRFDQSRFEHFMPPVDVDEIVRPAGRERSTPIGRFLQGPRKLPGEQADSLEAALGRHGD